MDLDERVMKLADGISVADAVQAYARMARSTGGTDDAQRARANEFEATIELMFLMAAVDGHVSGEELGQLRASLEALGHIHGIETLHFDATLRGLNDRLEAEGWGARLADAASRLRSEEGRTFAFRLAAGVAFVDDFVAHAEAAAIDTLSRALSLAPADSEAILQDVHATLFGDDGDDGFEDDGPSGEREILGGRAEP